MEGAAHQRNERGHLEAEQDRNAHFDGTLSRRNVACHLLFRSLTGPSWAHAGRVLIAARYLVDRMRQPRSRADEARRLRLRFAAEVGAARSGEGSGEEAAKGSERPPESAVAAELRALRLELAAAVGAVESCKSCAIGHPPPHGRFSGGHCCGLQTEDAFNDDEVAALASAGTRPADLRLPRGDHAGCAFRGPGGCSLELPHRPNLCVRYLCPDLKRELHRRGDLAAIERIGERLESAYLRFITLRKVRLDEEEAAALAGTIEKSAGRTSA